MDVAEMEENLFAAGDAKLHGGMCKKLSAILSRVLVIFPVLEAARPRSKYGIQALCSLHVALDKAKNLLQQCSESSKLYLAITGGSILIKFEKARCTLMESLRRVEGIVPQAIGCQVLEIVSELEGTVFTLDDCERQVGDEVIALLQKERKVDDDSNDGAEMEVFHQAASKLGITSSRAALTERRALKKLIERARAEEDKRKESVVAYLLHLLRKYAKLFRSEVADDTDSPGSTPCSPTDLSFSGGNGHTFARHLSKLGSFNLKQTRPGSGNMQILPEEFRCPISLQLMYDPVIISSGQTFERISIEKWINDGHNSCPKTKRQLSHLDLTPNYCVKGLISSWCKLNGVPIPDGPPESVDLHYWRLALSENETVDSISFGSIDACETKCVKVVPLEESSSLEEVKGPKTSTLESDSISLGSIDSCKRKGIKVVPLEESSILEDMKGHETSTSESSSCPDDEVDEFARYHRFLTILSDEKCSKEKLTAVEEIRFLLKDDEEARFSMGLNGFAEALVQFLKSAIGEGDEKAQEVGAMALFNLAVNNNRNKGAILSTGVMELLEKMILNSETSESATALFLNLSCLDDAKPIIGLSKGVPFLIQLLQTNSSRSITCKHDTIYTLYNLSTHTPNIPLILAYGIIDVLHSLLTAPPEPGSTNWAEKALAIFINLASSAEGKREIISTPGLVTSLASLLDCGEPVEQEQAVSCLLVLCNGDEQCCHMVLQEGVIPGLVSMSANGTSRGKEKAQKLLKMFREQRQREPSPVQVQDRSTVAHDVGFIVPESKLLRKTKSMRLGKSLSHIWKKRSFTM